MMQLDLLKKIENYIKDLTSKWFSSNYKAEDVDTSGELTVESSKPSKVKGKYIFPCVGCLLQNNCSEICEKVEQDSRKLLKIMFENECCPDCGCKQLIEGPSGGACTNVKCADCGHWFNIGFPLFVERI